MSRAFDWLRSVKITNREDRGLAWRLQQQTLSEFLRQLPNQKKGWMMWELPGIVEPVGARLMFEEIQRGSRAT